jgi:hypothetical protein
MDLVAAHEMGHIFYALDQYPDALQPCTMRSGYLSVENQNSGYSSCALNVSSIMRNPMIAYPGKAIDPYAAGQVGWRDSDGILDPLDVELLVGMTVISQNSSSVIVSGTAEIVPYPSPTQPSVTINILTGVRYRFDRGDWQQATADDDSFDGTLEVIIWQPHFCQADMPCKLPHWTRPVMNPRFTPQALSPFLMPLTVA